MKNYFLNGIHSTTVLAPISLFFAYSIKAFANSYQEQAEQLKLKEELKAQGLEYPETTAIEHFKKSYLPFFPILQTEKLPDSPQCKK